MVWSGEIIHPEPGARFDLEVIGFQSLKVGVTGGSSAESIGEKL
jgi:hypothetical protein